MSVSINDDMQYMKCKSVKEKKSNITNMSVPIHDDMKYMKCKSEKEKKK